MHQRADTRPPGELRGEVRLGGVARTTGDRPNPSNDTQRREVVGGGKARIAAVHVVSDVPQSADTLHGFSPTRAERALAAAVDVWVEAFGIAELELSS